MLFPAFVPSGSVDRDYVCVSEPASTKKRTYVTLPSFPSAVRRFVDQLNAQLKNPLEILAITSGGVVLVNPKAPKGNPLAASVCVLTGAPDGFSITSHLAHSLLVTVHQHGQGLLEFFREEDRNPAPVSIVLVDYLTTAARRVLVQDLALMVKWQENFSWVIATDDGEIFGNCPEILLFYPTNLVEIKHKK